MESLSSYVAGILGRAFFYVGLVPSAIAVFFWNAYLMGYQEFVRQVARAFAGDEAAVATAVVALLSTCGIALVLHASRNLVLALYRSIPRPAIVRSAFIEVQRRRKSRAEGLRVEYLWLLSALRWCMDGFSSKLHVPEGVRRPRLCDAISASRRARALLCNAEADGLPVNAIDIIGRGIAQLGASGGDPCDAAYLEELKDWKAVVNDRTSSRQLELLRVELQRR